MKLTSIKISQWRIRIGDYRIRYDIEDNKDIVKLSGIFQKIDISLLILYYINENFHYIRDRLYYLECKRFIRLKRTSMGEIEAMEFSFDVVWDLRGDCYEELQRRDMV